jgi:hypothetical protein
VLSLVPGGPVRASRHEPPRVGLCAQAWEGAPGSPSPGVVQQPREPLPPLPLRCVTDARRVLRHLPTEGERLYATRTCLTAALTAPLTAPLPVPLTPRHSRPPARSGLLYCGAQRPAAGQTLAAQSFPHAAGPSCARTRVNLALAAVPTRRVPRRSAGGPVPARVPADGAGPLVGHAAGAIAAGRRRGGPGRDAARDPSAGLAGKRLRSTSGPGRQAVEIHQRLRSTSGPGRQAVEIHQRLRSTSGPGRQAVGSAGSRGRMVASRSARACTLHAGLRQEPGSRAWTQAQGVAQLERLGPARCGRCWRTLSALASALYPVTL